MGIRDRLLRRALRFVALPYVVIVAAMATLGFALESTPLILLAAVLTLPSSVVAVPSYYLVYGLLAQIPGANPSRSSGSGSCAPNGGCHESTMGDAAAWFTHATALVGIIGLTAAAVLNVVLLQRLIAATQQKAGAPTQPGM
ncbi:MAG TPA: hypothetical protein VI452_17910 [Marmoricola sp.]